MSPVLIGSSNVILYICFLLGAALLSTSPVGPPLRTLYLSVLTPPTANWTTASDEKPSPKLGLATGSGPVNSNDILPIWGILDDLAKTSPVAIALSFNFRKSGASFDISNILYLDFVVTKSSESCFFFNIK